MPGGLRSTDFRNKRLAPIEHGSMKPISPSPTGNSTSQILVGHASVDVDSKLEQSRLADDGTLPMGMQNIVTRSIRVRAQ